METRVQIATHFTIDPTKQTLGAIEYPEKVTITLAIGEHIDPQKIEFDVAITAEQKSKIEEQLNALIIETGRTAKPINTPVTGYSSSTTTAASEEDEEIDLF